MAPFRFVYGLEVVVPMGYVVPSLRTAIQEKLSLEASIQFKKNNYYNWKKIEP